MKKTDVMLGDWVKVKEPAEINIRIAEIYQTGIIGEDGGPYLYGDIFPIPLTPEILEKNGFKEDNMYFRMDLDERTHLEYYPFEARLQRIYIDWDYRREVCFVANAIYDVHQLQHCLRMNCIEKEVEL